MCVTTGTAQTSQRDDLVVSHVGLVKVLAQRLAKRLPVEVEVADLIGVGVLGLMEAAERYRPSTGVPFDAFARRRVQGAMLDSLRNLDWAPRSLRKLRHQVDRAIADLRRQLGREASDDEIAQALDLSPDEYGQTLERLRTLDVAAIRPIDGESPGRPSQLEVCVDPDVGPEVRLQRAELRSHLAAAIGKLPARERQILALYYDEELTLAEIGAVIGVCESRVCQLRSQAIARLRTLLREALGPDGAR